MARARLGGDAPAASRVAMRDVMRAIRRRGDRRARRLAQDWRGLRAGGAAAVGLRQGEPRQALDRAQEVALLVVAERDRLPRIARPRGAADAMNIGLGDLRQFKIDDMGDAVDVDAARGDVGRNQRARLSVRKAPTRARAGPGSCCREWRKRRRPPRRGPGDAVGAMLRAGEDDDARRARVVEQFDQHVALLRRFDEDDAVLDPVGGLGGGRHRDLDRIMQQFAGERADVSRHGRREEQVLPLLRQFPHDAADRLDEAEIEHLVDLVEHQEFDRAEIARRGRRDDRGGGRESQPARRGPP